MHLTNAIFPVPWSSQAQNSLAATVEYQWPVFGGVLGQTGLSDITRLRGIVR